jgi:hypothetical protein
MGMTETRASKTFPVDQLEGVGPGDVEWISRLARIDCGEIFYALLTFNAALESRNLRVAFQVEFDGGMGARAQGTVP